MTFTEKELQLMVDACLVLLEDEKVLDDCYNSVRGILNDSSQLNAFFSLILDETCKIQFYLNDERMTFSTIYINDHGYNIADSSDTCSPIYNMLQAYHKVKVEEKRKISEQRKLKIMNSVNRILGKTQEGQMTILNKDGKISFLKKKKRSNFITNK